MNRQVAGATLACAAMLTPVLAPADPRGIGEAPPLLTPELLEARRAKLSEDMAAWLPRLVGRFRVEGIVDYNGDTNKDNDEEGPDPADPDSWDPNPTDQPESSTVDEYDPGDPINPLKLKSASGSGDCIAIGDGPGVHCLFHVTWDAEWTAMGGPIDGGDPFLAPAMKLFGLEPQAQAIQHLQLDTDGVAELETATLKGNTLSWIYPTRCESDAKPLVVCRRTSRLYARPGSMVIQWAIDYEKWDPTLVEADPRKPSLGPRWLRVTGIVLDLRREVDDHLTSAFGVTPPGL
jgi:hypothetical protein